MSTTTKAHQNHVDDDDALYRPTEDEIRKYMPAKQQEELIKKRNHQKKLVAQAKELQQFWSTPSAERDEKFKQIILQREIGLDDFSAILHNSIHKSESKFEVAKMVN
jgi:hypothetical protein